MKTFLKSRQSAVGLNKRPSKKADQLLKAKAMGNVHYEKDGRIGRITLNRTEAMNTIDGDPRILLLGAHCAN